MIFSRVGPTIRRGHKFAPVYDCIRVHGNTTCSYLQPKDLGTPPMHMSAKKFKAAVLVYDK